MRTCKEWMDSSPNNARPHTESSYFLKPIIIKEIRTAPNKDVLNRRYSIMDSNLRLMFEREELSGRSYSRLKIILRGEYETRLEALQRED